MKSLIKLVAITILVLSVSSLLTEEEYSLMTAHNDFQTLSYSEYVEIFKNKPSWGENGIGSAEEQLSLVKNFETEYKNKIAENAVDQEFLKEEITKRSLPALEREFDWKKANPACFANPIKDQQFCGSCYSFSATFVLAKRMCINEKNKSGIYNLDLSPQDLLECDFKHKKCHGGILPQTWEYLETEGVTTEACKPYYSGAEPPYVGNCKRFCQDWRLSYTKYKAKKFTNVVYYTDSEIKQEIRNRGPVSSFIEAFEDLHTYKTGLYRHRYGNKPEGHAISIVGWGYDATERVEYWIVANSWGAAWGENGYFRIPFGDSKIAIYALASSPDLY